MTKEERYRKYVEMGEKIKKEIQADRFEIKGEKGGYLVFYTRYGDMVVNLCI